MVVSQTTARNWQPREISLIKEVAVRLWDTILRSQAEEERTKAKSFSALLCARQKCLPAA
jgi:GAF domain-containing protein